LTAVFSIVLMAVAVQFGWLGPSKDFLSNLVATAVIWLGARVLSGLVGRF
jgi:hypothetical protein